MGENGVQSLTNYNLTVEFQREVRKMIKTKNLKCVFTNEDFETGVTTAETVLDGLDLEIEKGSFVAILGHNGSGKSTLAKHFNAIHIPTEGDVLVDGINTRDEDRVFEIRTKAGMVFQNPDNQMVAAIVEDDVAFAPENLGVEPEEIRKRVDNCLALVGMSKYAKSSPSKLSGGQKQRVAIASVLAMEPQCIILDESTAMLDPKGRVEVMKTIKKLNRENGMTVILITHYMDEAAQADRTIVINDGKIVLDDVPGEVFKNVEYLKSVGLDVPQMTELAQLLRAEGVDIPDVMTVDECFDELVKILGGCND